MTASSENRQSLFSLYALVIGSMICAGIFSLPRTLAVATGPFGALIAWVIAGAGMYMLACVFPFLAGRKPDLALSLDACARAGFDDNPGFLSAFGAPLSHAAWRRNAIRSFDGWAPIRRESSQ
jgi:arginine:ornithine antiporter/lysine permease